MNNRIVFITLLLLAAAAVLASAGCSGSAANATNANTAAPVVDITAARAEIRPIPSYFEATGNLVSDASTDVAPAVGGKIVQVNFDVGSYVNQGDVLIRLDDRDARIRLEQAQAQHQQAQSSVGQAQAQVEAARSGVRQALAQLGLNDTSGFNINQVPEVQNAKANLDLAEREFTRAARLLESGDIARTIYDQRRAQREQAQAAYESAVNGAKQRFAGVSTAQAQVATAEAAVRAARSAVQTAEAQVQAAQKAVSDTSVLAPISGYVSERVADVGEFISPNTPNAKVATIVRTSVLRLRIDVPEASIGKVATGQSISLQTSAYPDRNFAGTVVRISPSVNQTARTLTVEAEVPNPAGLLKPGQFATVRITQSKPEPAVMIPVAAVRTEGDVNRVFVIKDGIAHEQIVQLGLLENDMIQVKRGVVEGDVVATSNLNALSDGVFVRQ
ncbi:MAG: efflux RND transporter periplasmic adaptor subunit [Pyrinomonadaceae bacterium]